MVKRCTEEQWKQQFSHPWVLLENLEGVSFPLYHDEIQTEAKFLARTQDAFTRSDEEMLLFMEQGKALGWAHTYWIPQDRYLGLVSMAVPRNFGDALGQLLDYWGRQFPGYQWDAYFPQENKEAHRVLQSRGMKPQVQEAVGVLLFDQYHPRPENSRIAKLDREHFHLFRQVHQREEGKMYWTSDRIFATLEDWALYGYVQQGKCVAVLYYKGVGKKFGNFWPRFYLPRGTLGSLGGWPSIVGVRPKPGERRRREKHVLFPRSPADRNRGRDGLSNSNHRGSIWRHGAL